MGLMKNAESDSILNSRPSISHFFVEFTPRTCMGFHRSRHGILALRGCHVGVIAKICRYQRVGYPLKKTLKDNLVRALFSSMANVADRVIEMFR